MRVKACRHALMIVKLRRLVRHITMMVKVQRREGTQGIQISRLPGSYFARTKFSHVIASGSLTGMKKLISTSV